MGMNWNQLNTEEQLENIKKESFEHPVLIFKHSTTCSISATALNRFERKWNQDQAKDLKPYYLDLKAFRSVSNKIEADFAVQHESPQVLVIEKGKSIYDASHYDIVFEEVITSPFLSLSDREGGTR
jgi:bacillithiol system protein YtxJ